MLSDQQQVFCRMVNMTIIYYTLVIGKAVNSIRSAEAVFEKRQFNIC